MTKTKAKEKEFIPSAYQERIFDFIQNGQGNVVIEARAGCGKTTTLIEMLKYMPKDSSVLFTAFNKDIVKELEKRVKKIENVNVKVQSIHGIGFSMCQRNIKDMDYQPSVYKYKQYIQKNLANLSSFNLKNIGRKYFNMCKNVEALCELGRLNLCQSLKDMKRIEERYEIETMADECEIALKVMKWGQKHTETIDYTDMVWLPNVLNFQPYGYKFDFIIIDEAQDMNKAQRELVLRCRKINTRIIASGDENQCIYSFSGSDPESFSTLKAMPNTISLPLSISYRCADSIIKEAQKIVPSIEPNDEGRLGSVDYDVRLDEVKDGDMILCRTNAPLLSIYNEFLRMGKKSFIRGKDIGNNLISLVKETKQTKLNPKLNADGVFVRLYGDLIDMRDKIMERYGIDAESAILTPIFANKFDMINALSVLSEGLTTSEELIAKIEKVFPSKKKDMKDGIALSTIHKSKGLEAENVFIACASQMPSKNATSKWEKDQEENLIYVAYTRAKNRLGFLEEREEDKQWDNFNNSISQYLKKIEPIICRILGKKYTIPKNIEKGDILSAITANKPLEERKKIVSLNKTKVVSLQNKINKEEYSLNDFLNSRRLVKRLTYPHP